MQMKGRCCDASACVSPSLSPAAMPGSPSGFLFGALSFLKYLFFTFFFFFFFFLLTSWSLLACHPLVSNRQALSTSLSWREGWGAEFSPKFMGGKPGGAFPSPHKPLPALFPLHPFPLPCSCCDCLDWQQETPFHLPFLPEPKYSWPVAWCQGRSWAMAELGL